MGDHLPPPGPERDAELARALGIEPTRRAIATTDGVGSALTEDPIGGGLGGYRITADDVSDFCRRHPQYHVGAWEFWPPYSTDPAACDRLVEEMLDRGWILNQEAAGHVPRVHRHTATFSNAERGEHGSGPDRMAAVSAAALLALRGGR